MTRKRARIALVDGSSAVVEHHAQRLLVVHFDQRKQPIGQRIASPRARRHQYGTIGTIHVHREFVATMRHRFPGSRINIAERTAERRMFQQRLATNEGAWWS